MRLRINACHQSNFSQHIFTNFCGSLDRALTAITCTGIPTCDCDHKSQVRAFTPTEKVSKPTCQTLGQALECNRARCRKLSLHLMTRALLTWWIDAVS